ncbi:hypothetical protein [Sedimentimonas flavescens]|uniref:hypothetical protein n=1 Tax=Sedimentimonas flavescens TaxID=2851012 RepID=UPI001C4A2154|nr:hypothetical protein [Sedimentimonas flavescens]MBW0157626.1 hypothetical protein [Sedimentimonas flavescens]
MARQDIAALGANLSFRFFANEPMFFSHPVAKETIMNNSKAETIPIGIISTDEAARILDCAALYVAKLAQKSGLEICTLQEHGNTRFYLEKEVRNLAALRNIDPRSQGYMDTAEAAAILMCPPCRVKWLMLEENARGRSFPGQRRTQFYPRQAVLEKAESMGLNELREPGYQPPTTAATRNTKPISPEKHGYVDLLAAADILGCSSKRTGERIRRSSLKGRRFPGAGNRLYYLKRDLVELVKASARSSTP